MKKKNLFTAGILALALVFTFVLAGCPEEESEASPAVSSPSAGGEVKLPAIDNPDVNVRIYTTYVKLTWNPVMEADSYEVWRKFGNQNVRINTQATVTDVAKKTYDFNDTTITANTTYTYTVIAKPSSPVRDHGRWSDTVTTYPPLFGDTGSFVVNPFTINGNSIPADSDNVTGFFASLSLSSIGAVPGVRYSVERTTLDTNGNPGAWKDLSKDKLLSTTQNSHTPLPDQTMDMFGNLSSSYTSVYDRTLPLAEAKYSYRLKAERASDNVTEYLYADYSITIDFVSYLMSRLTLDIGGRGGDGSAVYTITPNLTSGTKRGILKEGDKVVLYWILGRQDSYSTGPYNTANTIFFSKSNLESSLGSLTDTKDLEVLAKGGDNQYLYVQAWLERVGGDKYSFTSSNWTGVGRTGTNYSNNGQYHVQLSY
jgi:hypothetical protein